MTTFADLVASTITVTKRPDLVAETTLALKRAITKEHAAMDYPRDLAVLAPITLSQPSPNNYRYNLSLATLAISTKARKITRIGEYISPQSAAANTFISPNFQLEFKERAHNNLFDGYGQEVNSYYYRFGDTINIVAPRQVDNIFIQYYALPSLADTSLYSDWMADMYDYVLYSHAAAEIFRIIGKSEEQRMQLAMTQDHRLDIIKNEIGAI